MSDVQGDGGGSHRMQQGIGDAGIGLPKFCHECHNEFMENVDECPG